MSSPPTKSRIDQNDLLCGYDLCETTRYKIIMPDKVKANETVQFDIPGYGPLRYKVRQSDIETGHIIVNGTDLPAMY